MGNNLNKKKPKSPKKLSPRNIDSNTAKNSSKKRNSRLEEQNLNLKDEAPKDSFFSGNSSLKITLQPHSFPSSYSLFPSAQLKGSSDLGATNINSAKTDKKDIIIYGKKKKN